MKQLQDGEQKEKLSALGKRLKNFHVLLLVIICCLLFDGKVEATCYYQLPPTGTTHPLDTSSKSLDTILTNVPTDAGLLNCYLEDLVGTIPTKIGDYVALTYL